MPRQQIVLTADVYELTPDEAQGVADDLEKRAHVLGCRHVTAELNDSPDPVPPKATAFPHL